MNNEKQIEMEELHVKMLVLAGRIPAANPNWSEQATKQALIVPFFDVLGYCTWNPQDFCPEYEADFAVKKAGQKEKVDFAVLSSDVPQIFVETKAIGVKLDGHEGQLARYYNAVPSVKLGVLTNGVDYRFYTDLAEPNLMDKSPFRSFSITDEFTSANYAFLLLLKKVNYNIAALRDYAGKAIITDRVMEFLRAELNNKSGVGDAFAKWVLSNVETVEGRISQNVIDRYRHLITQSLQAISQELCAQKSVGVSSSRAIVNQPKLRDTQQTGREEDQADDEPTNKDDEGKMRLDRIPSRTDISLTQVQIRLNKNNTKTAKSLDDYIVEAYKNSRYYTVFLEPLTEAKSVSRNSMWLIKCNTAEDKNWIEFNLPDNSESDPVIEPLLSCLTLVMKGKKNRYALLPGGKLSITHYQLVDLVYVSLMA